MIQFLKIDFNTGKIQKRKEKQGVCVEYETEKINDKEYLRNILKQVILIYEKKKPIKIEFHTRKEKSFYEKYNTEPAKEYTPRAVIGITQRNERERKVMELIKLELKG